MENADDLLSLIQSTTIEQCKNILYNDPKFKFFFEASLPAALRTNSRLGHVLLICPDRNITEHFLALLSMSMPAHNVICSPQKANTMRGGDWCAAITNLVDSDIFAVIEEELNLESDCLDFFCSSISTFTAKITLGKGPHTDSISLDISPFTCVVCVEKDSKTLERLRPFFEYTIRIDKRVITPQIKEKSKYPIDNEACCLIAEKSEHNLQQALKLLSRVQEYFEYKGTYDIISRALVEEVVAIIGEHPSNEGAISNDLFFLLEDIKNSLDRIQKSLVSLHDYLEILIDHNDI